MLNSEVNNQLEQTWQKSRAKKSAEGGRGGKPTKKLEQRIDNLISKIILNIFYSLERRWFSYVALEELIFVNWMFGRGIRFSSFSEHDWSWASTSNSHQEFSWQCVSCDRGTISESEKLVQFKFGETYQNVIVGENGWFLCLFSQTVGGRSRNGDLHNNN